MSANRDDYLNSALAEDHRSFGYRGSMGNDSITAVPVPRWRTTVAMLALIAVTYAGFSWWS